MKLMPITPNSSDSDGDIKLKKKLLIFFLFKKNMKLILWDGE